MAVNPLFSGPKASTTPSRGQNRHNMSKSGGQGRLLSPAEVVPRKKPRLQDVPEKAVENDPFDDFDDELTADDLEEIDFIASQAFCTDSNANETALDRGNCENAKGVSLSSSGYQSVGSLSLSNITKLPKGNVTFSTQESYAKQPSVIGANTVSQSLYSKSKSAERVPLSVQSHPVQSNVNLPVDKFIKPVQGIKDGVAIVPSAGIASDGRSKSHLSVPPNVKTFANGSGVPLDQDGKYVSRLQNQIQSYKTQVDGLKQQVNAMKTELYTKEGEIKVLRQNLVKIESEVSRLKVERIQEDERLRKEQAQREKDLASQVENLKTQLEFKERELLEAQSSYRNLEVKVKNLDGTSDSPKRHPVTPRKSPCHSKSVSSALNGTTPTKSSTTSKGSLFPTAKSFMAKSPHSTQGVQNLQWAKVKSPQKTSNSIPSSPARPVPSSPSGRKKSVLKINPASQVRARCPSGEWNTSQLVGKLISGSSGMTCSDACSNNSGLLGVFQSLTLSNSVKNVEDPHDSSSTRVNSHQKARESLTHMLDPMKAIPPQGKTKHSTSSIPKIAEQDSTIHLLGLLPLLEEQLFSYSEQLKKVVNDKQKQIPSSDVNSTVLQEDLCSDRGDELNQLSKSAVGSLHSLQTLCHHRPVICKVLLEGSIHEEMDTSRELDPSAPLISATQIPSRSSFTTFLQERNLPDSVSFANAPCHIIQHLCSTLAVIPRHGQPSSEVIENTWILLSIISSCATTVALERLFELLRDGISACLRPQLSYHVNSCILSTLGCASKSWQVCQTLCSQSDSCPFLLMYHLGVQRPSQATEAEVTSLRTQIVDLLQNIVSLDMNGAPWVVETDCQCSVEVVGAIVLMLYRELKSVTDNKYNGERLHLFRKGVLLLHTLVLQSKGCTDQNLEAHFTQLVMRLHQLGKKGALFNEHEEGMLQDLWDIVAPDEADLMEDEDDDQKEELKNAMET